MLEKQQGLFEKNSKYLKTALVAVCIAGFVAYAIKGVWDISINIVTALLYPANFGVAYAVQRITFKYGLLFMIPLLFYSPRNFKVFKWQIWCGLSAFAVDVASACWVIGGVNYTPYLCDFVWNNSAVIAWAVLFALMMFLLQNKGKIQTYDSFVVAFASVVLGSWFYEALYPGNLGFTYLLNNPVALVSFGVLAFMAYRYRVKFSWILPVSFYLALFVQLPYFYDFDFSLTKYVFFYSTVYWITRFTVFPFFASYAWSFKGKGEKNE